MNQQDFLIQLNKTLSYYQENALSFWEGTKEHDVVQNYAALQTRLPGKTGMRILDFGCGPGRDLKYFKGRGHIPTGLDGCEKFCQMAREFSGCEVWQQEFTDLNLPENYFDGIFANASLFHVPGVKLLDVLKKLCGTLKGGGVLFSSNPRGNREYFDGTRYGNYMEFDVYENFLNSAGFEVIDHYYRPFGFPKEEQPWLAVVSRKR